MDDEGSTSTGLRKWISSILNAVGVPLLAVFTASAIGALIIASAGGNPLDAFNSVQRG